MEFWRVRQHYRWAARRLRARGRGLGAPPSLVRAEAIALAGVAAADRVDTERGVLQWALRSSRARLRRLIVALYASRLLQGEARPLSGQDDLRLAAQLQPRLREQGAPELADALAQLLAELERLAARATESAERLSRVAAHADHDVLRLTLDLDRTPPRHP